MHRFFIKKENIINNQIILTGEDVSHISKVLRLKQNDIIFLCDSEGKDYVAKINDIEKKEILLKIIEEKNSIGETDLDITIYQSLPKASKMDLIVQKCTELGATQITPVLSKRTVIKFISKTDKERKVERWQKIAEESAKQSGRGKIPKIAMPMTFQDALNDSLKKDLLLIPYEMEKHVRLKDVLNNLKPKTIGIFIGPEGGFEPDEIEYAIKNKGKAVTLGNRILRTETAAFMLLSCILYEFDQI